VRASVGLAAALAAAGVVVSGCGGAKKPAAFCPAGAGAVQAIPGAPAATPVWLTQLICARAASLGDPDPDSIVVTLGVHQAGRVVDRVLMHGAFTGSCTGINICEANIVVFTVDPRTRREVGLVLTNSVSLKQNR
jgi:hypothetical protein